MNTLIVVLISVAVLMWALSAIYTALLQPTICLSLKLKAESAEDSLRFLTLEKPELRSDAAYDIIANRCQLSYWAIQHASLTKILANPLTQESHRAALATSRTIEKADADLRRIHNEVAWILVGATINNSMPLLMAILPIGVIVVLSTRCRDWIKERVEYSYRGQRPLAHC